MVMFPDSQDFVLSEPADWGLMCLAKRVGHVCVSNTVNDLKDLFIISQLPEFLEVSSLH